jgi:hypothetical protein
MPIRAEYASCFEILGTSTAFDDGPPVARELERLAGRTEERAVRVRRHAVQARVEAGRDHARGDRDAELLHLREAEAHERSAYVIEQTAALYRQRVRRLTRPGLPPHAA